MFDAPAPGHACVVGDVVLAGRSRFVISRIGDQVHGFSLVAQTSPLHRADHRVNDLGDLGAMGLAGGLYLIRTRREVAIVPTLRLGACPWRLMLAVQGTRCRAVEAERSERQVAIPCMPMDAATVSRGRQVGRAAAR